MVIFPLEKARKVIHTPSSKGYPWMAYLDSGCGIILEFKWGCFRKFGVIKSIQLNFTKIKYAGNSVGRDIRVEVKAFEKFFRVDKRSVGVLKVID